MSLEQSINELNTNILALIAALGSGIAQPTGAGKTEAMTSDQHLEQAAEHVSKANEKIKADKPKAEKKVEIKDEPEQPAEDAAPTVTDEDCKAITLQLASKKGRDAAVAVLAEFGVAKANELKADQLAEYHAAATAALAGA